MDVGQDDYTGEGDLTVAHECLHCDYYERGPSTPDAAKKSASTLAELLRRQRLEGVVIPLVYSTEKFPEEAW